LGFAIPTERFAIAQTSLHFLDRQVLDWVAVDIQDTLKKAHDNYCVE
jgi:hypothetical protein